MSIPMPPVVAARLLLLLPLALAACSSDPEGSADAQVVAEDAAPPSAIDAGVNADAAMMLADAGPDPTDAAGPNDAAAPGDAALGGDAGVRMPALMPGQYVDLVEGRVTLGMTYGDVTRLLGRGTRTATMNTRSYEWTLPSGVELTVWFANSNLDDDDPPADVDATDQALWIAVAGTFTGRTMDGLGLGSTRAEVEAAHGPAPRVTVIDMPPGQLAQYYTRGFLAAYAQDGTVRTFTVTKRYPQEPNGRIDIANLRIEFMGGNVTMNLLSGTEADDIVALLGPPDSRGPVPNQNGLELLNYAFIGVEFVISTRTGDRAATAIVHAPFYGPTGNGTPGLGSTRADFEAYALQTLMASGPTPSTRTMGVFCFALANARTFGVTYTMDTPARVSAIILGQCM